MIDVSDYNHFLPLFSPRHYFFYLVLRIVPRRTPFSREAFPPRGGIGRSISVGLRKGYRLESDNGDERRQKDTLANKPVANYPALPFSRIGITAIAPPRRNTDRRERKKDRGKGEESRKKKKASRRSNAGNRAILPNRNDKSRINYECQGRP